MSRYPQSQVTVLRILLSDLFDHVSNPFMKLFRYRRPSLKTIFGVTKAKKRIKKDLGITALLKPFRAWGNAKRRFKRKVGYESEAGRLLRDGVPTPGGCVVMLLIAVAGVAMIVGGLCPHDAPAADKWLSEHRSLGICIGNQKSR